MHLAAGIIGYRNHSLKIIRFLLKEKKISKIFVYCYKSTIYQKKLLEKKNKKIIYVNKLDDLKKSKLFFITSPSVTHTYYIKKLLFYKRPIFCEKPGFSSLSQYHFLKKLKNINKKRIYFNYNLLHSKLFELVKKETENDRLINISVNSCIGISFLKKFKNNWRFTSNNGLERIAGNLGVHHVNFSISLLGNLKGYCIAESAIANNKKKIDTASINLNFSNNSTANFFLSYAAPMTDRIEFYFSNKIIFYENGSIYEIGPRNIFDKCGLFKRPKKKLIHKFVINLSEDSLFASINFFIKTVFENKNFKVAYFNNALAAGKLFLKSV